jgi:outer membrane protein OmpA-like peptidoglycan-associated protein
MRILKIFLLILLGFSNTYGQRFTLQDTILRSGDILISYSILFEFDKANIRPESYSFLDSIVTFMTKNKNITLELSNHSDERFPDYYSSCLTCKRAQVIKNYLISKGVIPERLLAAGYNDQKPIIVGAKTEEEHQKE